MLDASKYGNLIQKSLRIKAGHSILLIFPADLSDIISGIAMSFLGKGIFPLELAIPSKKDYIKDAFFLTDNAIEHFENSLNDNLRDFDFIVLVNDISQKYGSTNDTNHLSLTEYYRFTDRIKKYINENRVKTCLITLPPHGFPHTDMISDGQMVDLSAINDIGYKLKKLIENANEIKISCKSGTNISFNVGFRSIIVDDGILDDQDLQNDWWTFVPGGVVCAKVNEESVNGRLVIEKAYDTKGIHKGTIKNLVMNFNNGRLISSSADEGYEIFNEIITNASGDKDKFAEFGIGLNSKVNQLIEIIQIDELIKGAIHVAIGHNADFGGDNVSDLHWDFIIVNPTLLIDNNPIIIDGRFQKED